NYLILTIPLFMSNCSGRKNDGPHVLFNWILCGHSHRQLIKHHYGKINVPIQRLTQ
uniref:Uncharacterized protein n=1 Tax=Dicentrarchus labrax TaxID=13489 RepID=A0A8C4FAA1_DICLA